MLQWCAVACAVACVVACVVAHDSTIYTHIRHTVSFFLLFLLYNQAGINTVREAEERERDERITLCCRVLCVGVQKRCVGTCVCACVLV